MEIGKWNTQTAHEQFGVEFSEPAMATARNALFAILSDTNLMRHLADWNTATGQAEPKVDEAIQGESEPSQEG